jgi:Fe2+ or Zn2+ uptake regulation protein
MTNTHHEHQVLEVFRISPTPIRSKVLSHILEKSTPFTVPGILSEMQHNQCLITQTTLSNILRLFHVRGLIHTIDSNKTHRRGRPQTLFVISAKASSVKNQNSKTSSR